MGWGVGTQGRGGVCSLLGRFLYSLSLSLSSLSLSRFSPSPSEHPDSVTSRAPIVLFQNFIRILIFSRFFSFFSFFSSFLLIFMLIQKNFNIFSFFQHNIIKKTKKIHHSLFLVKMKPRIYICEIVIFRKKNSESNSRLGRWHVPSPPVLSLSSTSSSLCSLFP
jgi:hypothetical protein